MGVARGDLRNIRCNRERRYARIPASVGQVAVAEVILNRVDSARYPDTVCDVVAQGAGSGRACQFSYNCDGEKNRIAERRVYERIGFRRTPDLDWAPMPSIALLAYRLDLSGSPGH